MLIMTKTADFFIAFFAHLYPIEHRFLDKKIKFTALSALLHLPRLKSDGSLSEPSARYEKGTAKKYERSLIYSKAVGNAHNTDKSRPYILWTLADLLFGVTH